MDLPPLHQLPAKTPEPGAEPTALACESGPEFDPCDELLGKFTAWIDLLEQQLNNPNTPPAVREQAQRELESKMASAAEQVPIDVMTGRQSYLSQIGEVRNLINLMARTVQERSVFLNGAWGILLPITAFRLLATGWLKMELAMRSEADDPMDVEMTAFLMAAEKIAPARLAAVGASL